MSTPHRRIEEIIGRKLLPEEQGSVPNLNEFPPHLLAEARKIYGETKSRLLTFVFVHFYAGPGGFNDAKHFVEDVAVGGQEPAHWRCEPLLCCPGVDASQALELSRSKVVTLLEGIPGERWVRLVPQRASWDHTVFGGAPAVVNRSANYRWQSPKEVHALVLTGSEAIETIDDLATAVRRWIASRLAWQLAWKPGGVAQSVDTHALARILSEDKHLSADAEIAIRGLLREECELGPSSEAVPGFRGPDEWYAG